LINYRVIDEELKQKDGLAVSQEPVNGMEGKIWLESEVGKGTTFFFTIPKVE